MFNLFYDLHRSYTEVLPWLAADDGNENDIILQMQVHIYSNKTTNSSGALTMIQTNNIPLSFLYRLLFTPECLTHSSTCIHVVISLDSAQLCMIPDQTFPSPSCQLAVSPQNISNLRVMTVISSDILNKLGIP